VLRIDPVLVLRSRFVAGLALLICELLLAREQTSV
jgi:hypothetical protein